jgi:phosphoglycolate phosphatase
MEVRFDLLICDLDGTLVDTREGIVDTFQAVLSLAGLPAPSREDIMPYIGLPLDFMFRHFLAWRRPEIGGAPSTRGSRSRADLDTPSTDPDWLSAVVADLIAAYRQRYHELVTPTTRAFPGVRETLESARSLGIRLAIATSKLTAIAEESLAAAGLLSLFAKVYGMDAVDRPKPAPDLAIKCLVELGADSRRALVVGDAVHDVEMGRAAGCATCAVTYGAQTRDELILSNPDYFADVFSDLLAIVRG